MSKFNIYLITFFCLIACSSNNELTENKIEDITFYKGADLSYVNEMEDCGASYKNLNNVEQDVYSIFKNEGCNLVRVRLWHNPNWTNYSNLNDVKLTISRAKNQGMKVLLNFHYSDTWADPSKQEIPEAWASNINNTEALGNQLYNYTQDVLEELYNENLEPNIVQIGNEINGMILQQGELQWPIDWNRNSYLINKGIRAVRDFSLETDLKIEIMLHIAQPENALWWFQEATENNVFDYDWIGLSYYPNWSSFNLNTIQEPLETLINTYNKELMIVETAYPYTLNNNDTANNVLGEDGILSDFPISTDGQLQYLNTLKEKVKNAGGKGIVYWEPAWVSTNCFTLWGQGSHWDNATLFDNNNKAIEGIKFYNE